MATEKRLIDASPLIEKYSGGDELKSISKSLHDSIFVEELRNAPIVDAVPVDDIKLHHILIDNEGVPEVKLQIGDRYFVLRTDPVDAVKVVHCENCNKSDDDVYPAGKVWCHKMCRYMDRDGFCSFGEER